MQRIAFIVLLFLFFSGAGLSSAEQHLWEPYRAVTGLLDVRSTFSDGGHSIEELVRLASSRGFRVLFINDHDRIAISYGVPPFRNILRYKKEYPSIMTHGPEKFLAEIKRVSEKYPEMIIIPGCETSAYYYWTGSWFNKTLTAHEYDRKMLIVNFERAEDYRHIPNLHNSLSLRYTKKLVPGLIFFVVPFFIGLFMIFTRGKGRRVGFIIMILSGLAIVDYNPFRSSLFSPYKGSQGILPYQELIDYVNQRGGYSFWNYVEQWSGVRKHGPIQVDTPPYPQVLHESRDFSGFAAIYGTWTKATSPGREWDRVLNEYCRGQRKRPVWGISTADFHEDGRLGQKLGAFPTIFLVKSFSKSSILEAMEKGRMFSSRGDGKSWPQFDYFSVTGAPGEKAVMGETLNVSQYPLIKFRVSFQGGKQGSANLLLIRGGKLIHTFKGEAPLEAAYEDREIVEGEKTFYRVMDSRNHLLSNPVFIRYRSSEKNDAL